MLSSLALCLFEVLDISGCPLMKRLLWIRAVKSNLALIHLWVICVAEMAHEKIPLSHYSLPGLFFVQSKQREFIKIWIKFMGTHRINKKVKLSTSPQLINISENLTWPKITRYLLHFIKLLKIEEFNENGLFKQGHLLLK